MELNTEDIEDNQDQALAVLTRAAVVASEDEINEWKSAQEEDPVVRDTIQRVRQR